MNFYELLFNRGQPSGEGMTHFERLFAAKLVGGGEIKELEGVPPLLFKANGEPLIDWSIYGNTIQNGTPTPQNPVDVLGTGERTANLFDGEIEVGGLNTTTGAETEQTDRRRSDYIEIEENTNYNLSRTITATTSNLWALFYDENKDYISRSNKGTSDANFTVLSPANAKFLRWYVTSNGSYDNLMIIEGSTTPPEYIPYGYKIPISCGGTTNNVYLGEVQTTRRIRKIVFIGSEDENWSGQAAGGGATRFRYTLANSVQADTAHLTSICTHLPLGVEGGTWNTDDIYTISNNYLWLRLDSSFTTVSALKSYLQQQYANGTPVTVWYALATEETAVVNEPLMKIGNYADSLTATQAGTEIATVKGSNTLDIDTTVKPSNVYIKYKD